MPIPDYQSLMLPVLRFTGDRKEHALAELRQRIAAEFTRSNEGLNSYDQLPIQPIQQAIGRVSP